MLLGPWKYTFCPKKIKKDRSSSNHFQRSSFLLATKPLAKIPRRVGASRFQGQPTIASSRMIHQKPNVTQLQLMMHGNLKFHPHQHRRRPFFFKPKPCFISICQTLPNCVTLRFLWWLPSVSKVSKKAIDFQPERVIGSQEPSKYHRSVMAHDLNVLPGQSDRICGAPGFRSGFAPGGMSFIQAKFFPQAVQGREKSQVCLLKTVKKRQKPKFQLSLFQTNT